MHHRPGGCCNRITGPGQDADTAKGDTIGKEQKEPSPTRLHTRNVPEPERQRQGTRREMPGMAKDWYRCQREGFRPAPTRMWFGISFVLTSMDHFQRENLVVGFESFPSLLFFLFFLSLSNAGHSVRLFFAYTTLFPSCAKIPTLPASLPQAKTGAVDRRANKITEECFAWSHDRHASGTSIIYLGLINFIRPLIHLSCPHEVCEIILTRHSVWCNRIGVPVHG